MCFLAKYKWKLTKLRYSRSLKPPSKRWVLWLKHWKSKKLKKKIYFTIDSNRKPEEFPDLSYYAPKPGQCPSFHIKLIISNTTTTKRFIPGIWSRLHEPKENYVRSGTWISFLHSFLSSNMPSLRPLASISCCITSIHVFFGLPFALLTCPKMISSTRRTGASVGLHRIWPNHRKRFSLIFSFKLIISNELSLIAYIGQIYIWLKVQKPAHYLCSLHMGM